MRPADREHLDDAHVSARRLEQAVDDSPLGPRRLVIIPAPPGWPPTPEQVVRPAVALEVNRAALLAAQEPAVEPVGKQRLEP